MALKVGGKIHTLTFIRKEKTRLSLFANSLILYIENIKEQLDFSGGPVVRNLPANAEDPWPRNIPYAEGQLSLQATATELAC